jgi:hypothetical protein
MLDGLLESVVASRLGLVPGFGPLEQLDAPIAREPGGRFYLATSPVASWEAYEPRFLHQRFPVHEAQMFGDAKLRRVNIGAGPCRSYRIPDEVAWADGDAIRWWCIGDRGAVADHLLEVRSLGRKRGTGRGVVSRWSVEPCETWGDGFPVVRGGKAMRPLPLDWPGLVDAPTAYRSLAPPYWDHTADVLCAVP